MVAYNIQFGAGITVEAGVMVGPSNTFTLSDTSIQNYDGDAGWTPGIGFDCSANNGIDFFPNSTLDPLNVDLNRIYGDPGAYTGGYHLGIWHAAWANGSGYVFLVHYATNAYGGYGIYMQPTDISGNPITPPGLLATPATFTLIQQSA